MNRQQDFDTTIRVPVVTDLVRPGDPDIIQRVKSGESSEKRQNFEKRLKERIAELQSAAGQDEYSGLARAHAIRSEKRESGDGDADITETPDQTRSMSTDYERQIDKSRHDIIRELSTMLK
ncbi:MAG: Unknown protein [uncultured Thiotrichaceae bacterium]|uniref:Uncharacterized protein n=1 Tax=uncultured Thiotrichaceae bacterium TaxID=298394 RepID=A0A6S6U135_9GAMM|nr:MAG: Unknown protein [uncultured Thiotrichaceae bacterium]